MDEMCKGKASFPFLLKTSPLHKHRFWVNGKSRAREACNCLLNVPRRLRRFFDLGNTCSKLYYCLCLLQQSIVSEVIQTIYQVITVRDHVRE